MTRRDPLGEFNTAGLEKCQHCGDYKPEAWITSHEASCDSNPANRPPT